MALYKQTIETPIGSMLICSDEQSICLLEFLHSKYLDRHFRQLETDYLCSPVEQLTAVMKLLLSELNEYFEGKRTCFTVPIKLSRRATPFQHQVWSALLEIPFGKTISYSELAERIGRPLSVRATANAVGQNSLMVLVPCHRIIGSNGSLSGFAGGVEAKQHLLQMESPDSVFKT